jgi:UDP-glucuronate decarboxylase
MTKRVLVTGAAGFLASHLIDSLLLSGYTVVGIDDLSTGSMSNLQHIQSDKFSFILHDVRLPYNFGVFDEIWNLACPASPPKYQIDKLKTFFTSIDGVRHALLAAGDTATVFQASTSEIYGDPTITPQSETYWGNTNTIGIRSCYDEGKRAAETLLTDWSRQYGTPIRIARIFNTYGDRMDKNDGRVVSNFINQALSGSDITIYGDGTQTRSFCHVSDLIRGFRLLMDSPYQYPINIGNPGEFTVLQLAHKILQKIKTKSQIVFNPLPSDDPKQRCPDITNALNILRWSPVIDLNTGLDSTILYFKGKL